MLLIVNGWELNLLYSHFYNPKYILDLVKSLKSSCLNFIMFLYLPLLEFRTIDKYSSIKYFSSLNKFVHFCLYWQIIQ